MPRQLDDTDRAIIHLLTQDSRIPNKQLASRLDVSETTIAGRIRGLIDDNVMRVTLQRDFYSVGYEFQGHADIYVFGRNVDDVAVDLGRLVDVQAVALQLGSPDILVSFGARSREHLATLLNEQIARVVGIKRIEVHLVTQIAKYESGYALLGLL